MKVLEQWNAMIINQQYNFLSLFWIHKDKVDQPVIKYLRETGLQFLFETRFAKEQDNWKRLIDKAFRYNQIWSLPSNWQVKEKTGGKKRSAIKVVMNHKKKEEEELVVQQKLHNNKK